MHVRDDYGVGVILAPLRRRVDWTEPPADEGDWDLPAADKVGDDD